MGLPNIGPMELIIVLVIALVVVGPSKLPEMGSAVGRTIREFRKSTSGLTDPIVPELEPDKAAGQTMSDATPPMVTKTSAPKPAGTSADQKIDTAGRG